MSKVITLFTTAMLLVLTSAVTWGQGAPAIRPARPVRPAEDEKKRAAEQKKSAEKMKRAIKELLAGKRGVDQVRLDVNWARRWVAVYGREEIGIWNPVFIALNNHEHFCEECFYE